MRVRGRGEVQTASTIGRTQPHCVARATTIGAEWIPSAFLPILGAIHQSVPGLPTRKTRIPPAGTGWGRKVKSPSRCRSAIVWPHRSVRSWRRGLHIHNEDMRPPRRARISGIAPPSRTVPRHRGPLGPPLSILKAKALPRSVRFRRGVREHHRRLGGLVRKSLAPSVGSRLSSAVSVESTIMPVNCPVGGVRGGSPQLPGGKNRVATPGGLP